jgi:hypothetical protein
MNQEQTQANTSGQQANIQAKDLPSQPGNQQNNQENRD